MMRLTSLWTSITGLRVKEISAESPDFWPERGRPTTSAAVRAARRGQDAERRDQPERRSRRERLARSFSRPRHAQGDFERARSKPAERTRALDRDMNKALPDVPTIPPLPVQPRWDLYHDEVDVAEDAPPQDVGQPGTAITTEGLQALSIFELAAAPPRTPPPPPPPRRKTIDNAYQNPNHPLRSKSAGPDNRHSLHTLHKKSSWFRLSNVSRDTNLAPAPPPLCPLPPLPPSPRTLPPSSTDGVSRAPSVESESAIVESAERPSTSSAATTTPSLILDDNDNDNDSLLDSFPLPRLVHDIDETPESSVADYSSEVGSMHQPSSPLPAARESFSLRYKKIPAPISTHHHHSAYGHKHKDSGIGTPRTPHTPTSIRRWTRQASSFEYETSSPLHINLEEWAEESAGRGHASAPSNDEALAALQFGVLK